MRNPDAPPRPPIPVLAAVLFAASLLVTECGVFCENHAVEVPLIEWIKNPALYPNDPFAGALARYPSLLWPMVAFASRYVALEPLLLCLFFAERLFVIAAAGVLARTLAPRSYLAPIATMTLFAFAIGSLMGGGTIVDRYFEQTGLAIPFFLLAIAAFHAERPIAWGICLGAGLASNSLYGCYALTYFGASFALDASYRRSWRRWIPGLVSLGAVAAYPVYRGLCVLGGPLMDPELWLGAARARCWRHLFPLDWGLWPFGRFFGLMALLGAVLYLGKRSGERIAKTCTAWSAVACAWVLFAFVAAYGFQKPGLLMLQPARATDLWVSLAAIVSLCVCSEQIEAITRSGAPSEGRWRWTVLLGVLFLFWHPAGWTIVIALLLVSIVSGKLRRHVFSDGAPHRVALLLVLWACMAGLAGYSSRLADSEIAAGEMFRRLDASTLTNALLRRPAPAVRRAADWARASTPLDAVFLVNLGDFPDWDQFRGLSQRSIVTNWEEGTGIYWDRSFAPVWVERMGAFGFDPAHRTGSIPPEIELDERYDNLRDADIERVKTRFRIDYWIVPSQHPSGFPVAFQKFGYKVLDCR